MLLEVNADAVQRAMRSAGKTAPEIAADTGLSLATVSRLVRAGGASTRPSTLVKLANALGTTSRVLAGDEDTNPAPSAQSREDLLSRILLLEARNKRLQLDLDALSCNTVKEDRPPHANRIKAERIRAGLTAGELALRLGVSERTIKRYESQQVNLPARTIFRLADTFGCSIDHLLAMRGPGRLELSEAQ